MTPGAGHRVRASPRTCRCRPTVESAYSTDANLWGRSIECGVLEDPWAEPPDDIYTLTRAPQDGPDEPAYIEIEFEARRAGPANGIEMPLLELIESLETIAGAHGVGRIDMVENRLIGIKSREIYEAPAAVVLHTAHRELEKLVIARDLERIKHDLARTYADLVYNGLWFSQTREAIDAFVAHDPAARHRRGPAQALQRRLPRRRPQVRRSRSTIRRSRPTTRAISSISSATEGFIKIWGLPIETAARKAAAHTTPVGR